MDKFNQTERHYPTLPPDTHPDVVHTIHTLHDNVFDLRDQVQKMQSDFKASGKPAKSQFTGDIQGIKVKAVTDPSSLQNGFTLRFNSKTGEFEFGV